MKTTISRRSFLAAIASAIAARPAAKAAPFLPAGSKLAVDLTGRMPAFTPFEISDTLAIGPGLSITEDKGGRAWPFFEYPAPQQFFLERLAIDFPYWRQTEDQAAADREALLEAAWIRLASGGRQLAMLPLAVVAYLPPAATATPSIPLWPTWAADEHFKVELVPERDFELRDALIVRMTLSGYIDAKLLAGQI